MNKVILIINILICSTVLIEGLNLCGDCTQYKDIKCIKVLQQKATEEKAFRKCQELDESSSIITIHDMEEQEFLNNYLSKFANISINAWIGMKYNGKEYDWIDGTDSNFTNWSEYSVRDGDEPCVQMSLVSRIMGKWTDISCKKPAVVVCQKKQELSLKFLKNIIENMSEVIEKQGFENEKLKKSLENISNDVKLENQSLKKEINSLIPLGFLYTQFPNQSSPQQLWTNMEWTEVTQQYSGLFFRAEGSGSESFGQIQQANQSWISEFGVRCHYKSDTKEEEYSVGTYNFFDTDISVLNGYQCKKKFAGLSGFAVYTTAGEVRPKNTAVKIWKRIQ